MQNFGGALGVFIIIVVTLAQLAGKNKRANKGENRKFQKQRKIKGAKADSTGKIAAEESTTSFEVDGGRHDDVQGFDVK